MNNLEINQSPWMTLHEQVNYMCKFFSFTLQATARTAPGPRHESEPR